MLRERAATMDSAGRALTGGAAQRVGFGLTPSPSRLPVLSDVLGSCGRRGVYGCHQDHPLVAFTSWVCLAGGRLRAVLDRDLVGQASHPIDGPYPGSCSFLAVLVSRSSPAVWLAERVLAQE